MSILVAMLLMAAPALQEPAAVQVVDSKKVSAADKKPLYTFGQDAPGKSNCNDRCATAWPPLVAPADAKPVGKWTVIKRDDGSPQWAWDGKPVYTFVRDTAGAAPTGDGMGGVWHLLP